MSVDTILKKKIMTNKKKTLMNLKKIYNKLPELAKKERYIIDDFNMQHYGCYNYLYPFQFHMCNTLGCALGNSARLFDLNNNLYYLNEAFNYPKFGKIILPSLYYKGNVNTTWEFLFSSEWVNYQSTFNEFITRLKYVIDYDLEIPEWEYQTESFIK